MIVINLLYYSNVKNFGDQLSPFIIDSLIDKKKYKLVHNQKECKINLVGIGSYIHHAVNDSFIFGSGVRTNPSKEGWHKYNNLKVCAVRGPLSKEFLNAKKIHVPCVFGDPALLLPKFYKPIINNNLNEKIGLIPHISNYSYYSKLKLDDKFHLISPIGELKDIINQLCSCKYIISSSLHGLICADAYNIPNLWLDEIKLPEGDFKFKDYFMSQNRNYVKIKNYSEFDIKLLYTGGNKIDLEKLINSFPFK
jgi:pyruvyltransferase